MLPRLAGMLLLLAGSACAAAAREPTVGRFTEGTDALFAGLPAQLGWRARIAPSNERGEPLLIEGTVRDAAGRPVAGVVIYAHHTNRWGYYPRHPDFPAGSTARRHGRLRGWVQTDAEGRYQFETIRPGGYPLMDAPAHIHLQVLEPGRCTYVIDDLVFDDDSRLTAAYREASAARGPGGSGITKPLRLPDGGWRVRRDVVLGAHVANYPPRD